MSGTQPAKRGAEKYSCGIRVRWRRLGPLYIERRTFPGERPEWIVCVGIEVRL